MGRVTTRTLYQGLRLRRQARASRLGEFDRLKEELAYLKFWQGFAIVIGISLSGWLVSAADATGSPTAGMAITGVVLLGIVILVLHRQIRRRMDQIAKV